ncbi:MAG TPA: 50S ribosomal protein L5 [Candidatus Paceibacterota bacterium]|uniref:Large ribosomal subunit protein uL5 n=1 Tax=uncultured Parcubacteria bacterium Rifle_16ft_4_minimus_7278 TaxID=1665143 RepID=A0A0H4TCX3_9BACT|nr:50S ribosomal protein L5, large subunit ribosomal protein L5 [uncultured Parcubacteria bacterium Rifle_16ft_4_minimus_7278]HXK34918.1 50S ribosomal protein L5 [Candidatus Paceibacterota bacterium]
MVKDVKKQEKEAYKLLKDKFGFKNALEAPRLVKVVINVGTGSAIKKDSKRTALVIDRLTKITGQKPATRGAKKSIAGFKLRQGEEIGVIVTLRSKMMYGFLNKLFNVAFPRTKDFRGISRKVVDNVGNLTLGIKEHTIFPETHDEELRDVFGFAVTIATTAKNKETAEAFFEILGVPFR